MEASSVSCVFGPQGPGQDEGDGPEWQIKVLSCNCKCCRIEACEFRHEWLQHQVSKLEHSLKVAQTDNLKTAEFVKELVESNRNLLARVKGLEFSNNKLVAVCTDTMVDQHKRIKQRVEGLEYHNSKLGVLAAHFYEAYQRKKHIKRRIVFDPEPSEQLDTKRPKPDPQA